MGRRKRKGKEGDDKRDAASAALGIRYSTLVNMGSRWKEEEGRKR